MESLEPCPTFWGPRQVMAIGLVLWVMFEVGFLLLGVAPGNYSLIMAMYGLRGRLDRARHQHGAPQRIPGVPADSLTGTIGFTLEQWLRLLFFMFLSNIVWNLLVGFLGDKLGWRETVAV